MVYTRVSRDDTGEGRSNVRQREDCEKLADLRGWNVVAVHEDISISATSGKERPGWSAVLGMVDRGEVDVVLAWHVDRMTRSMVELEELILLGEKHNVGVATVTGDIDLTTDVGRMVARILGAVARAEVERKGARQRRANRQRASEGKAHAHPRPFGYEEDRVTVREVEAAAIRKACDDVLAGVPLSVVTRQWVQAGFKSSMSTNAKEGWSARGVRNVLLNPRHAGMRVYDGEVIGDSEWPAIVPLETHLAVRQFLENPSRRKGGVRSGRTPSALLTGIATCANCGKTVRGNLKRGVHTYRCPDSHFDLPRAELDEVVGKAVAFATTTTWAGGVVPGGPKVDTATVARQVETLSRRLDDLSTSYANGHITIGQLETASSALHAQLAEAEASMGGAAVEGVKGSKWAEAVRFNELSMYEQRGVLQEFARVEVRAKGGDRKKPLRECITVWLTDPFTGQEAVAFDETGVYLPLRANRPWKPPTG